MGVLSLDAAQRIASEKGLDLVEIAPQATPPVCRLLDYGRFKFETIKRENGKVVVVTRNGIIAASLEPRRQPYLLPYRY